MQYEKNEKDKKISRVKRQRKSSNKCGKKKSLVKYLLIVPHTLKSIQFISLLPYSTRAGRLVGYRGILPRRPIFIPVRFRPLR